MSISKFYSFLGRDDVILTVAFVAGLSWVNGGLVNAVKYPLSSLLSGIFSGAVAQYVASTIKDSFPRNMLPLISILLSASTVYYVMNPEPIQQ
jgi:fructose-specific phosphotransferase system IIC component